MADNLFSRRGVYPLLIAAVLTLVLTTACGNDRVVLTGPDVLLSEEFIAGQTGNWLVEGDDAGRTAVLNEQLFIEIEEPGLLQYAALAEPRFNDFILEVDATLLSGDLENSFGVLFRMQSVDQFYRFDVTGNGLYMMERRNADGSWTRFIDDWTESPAIKQGLAVTNRLKVDARGPLLSFYVNDQLLRQVNDASYVEGQIALDAGVFGRPGLQVAFDDLVVRKP